jgi:hypothetical protein
MNLLVRNSLLVITVFLVNVGWSQDLLKQVNSVDLDLYSGYVEWDVNYEVFVTHSEFDDRYRPFGLSDEEFEAWKEKLQQPRSQTFHIQAFFQSDFLRFDITSEPGDILPTPCDRTITFNGVSVTLIDHYQQIMFRESVKESFYDTHYAQFLIPPRACGFDIAGRLKNAEQVRSVDGYTPVLQSDEESSDSVAIIGNYPDGSTNLCRFESDSDYPQVLKKIKFINAKYADRVCIDNEDIQAHNDGIVFPRRSIVQHYAKGSLQEIDNDEPIDIITMDVVDAQFNDEYPEEFFNPVCPDGYKNLNDIRKIRIDNLSQ